MSDLPKATLEGEKEIFALYRPSDFAEVFLGINLRLTSLEQRFDAIDKLREKAKHALACTSASCARVCREFLEAFPEVEK